MRVTSEKLGVLFQESRALEDTSERVRSVEVERVLEVKSGRALLFGFNWPPGPVKEKISINRYFVLPVSVKKYLQVM